MEVERLSKAIEKPTLNSNKRITKQLQKDGKVEPPIALRRRGKHSKKITTLRRLEIADKVIRGQEFIADVAKEYRVTPARISQIVQKMRKQPEEVVDDINEHYDKALEDEAIASFIEERLMKG